MVTSVIFTPYVLDCHKCVAWINNILDIKRVLMEAGKMIYYLITLDIFINRTHVVC